jgi:hypothetical protein
MLYDSASNPLLSCLYICLVVNVLRRTPLIPCFISGNRGNPIIPNRFKDACVLEKVGSASTDTQRERAARLGRQQQALRGDNLDVALRSEQPPDGVYRQG